MNKRNLFVIILVISCSFSFVKSNTFEIIFVEIAEVNTGGEAFDLQIVGDIAFVIDTADNNPGGLVLINITDASNPQKLDSFYESGLPFSVCVVGNYSYIANPGTGLEIVNIADPTNITKIGSYYDGGETYQVEVINNIAFVADGSQGLEILNVSDPTNPTKINNYGNFHCPSLTINNNRAYLIDHREYYSGLVIVNVTDLNNPQTLGSFFRTNMDLIAPSVFGDLIFMVNHKDNTGEIQILNISIPSSISEVSSFKGNGYANKVTLEDDTLFVAGGAGGLEAVNLTDIFNPTLLGSYFDGGLAYDVAVQGDIVFLADRQDGLEIYEYSLNEITPTEKVEIAIIFYVITAIFVLYIFKRKKKGEE